MPEETSTPSAAESMEEKPCSSTSASDSSTDVMEEAKKLIGTGNRHLVMGDVVSAVAVFQDACGMLAARYGDTADECGEALFLCGKSLLELARMENTVLGNALEGVPEEGEDDDDDEEQQPSNPNIESANNLDEKTRDELRKQVYEAMAEEDQAEAKRSQDGAEEVGDANSPAKDGATSEAAESASPKVKEEARESPEKEPSAEDEEEEGSMAEEEPEDDDDDDDDEEDEQGEKNGEEEEVGNLQLAWEMLEVAKVIYKRKESKEDQLMAAQAYLKLGEVSAESGNYPQALEDFQECLSLQLKHLASHSRLLAETHYHVATTLCYMDQYPMAIQHYNSSVTVIEARLAMLQEAIDKAEGEEAASKEKGELEELRLLLPEIKEKVEDAKESQRTATAASRAIQQTLGGASTSSGFSENGSSSSSAFGASQIPVKPAASSSSSAVTDISHLVRKKRKPDEDSAVEDSGTKQAKRELNGNGDSSSEQQESASTETAA